MAHRYGDWQQLFDKEETGTYDCALLDDDKLRSLVSGGIIRRRGETQELEGRYISEPQGHRVALGVDADNISLYLTVKPRTQYVIGEQWLRWPGKRPEIVRTNTLWISTEDPLDTAWRDTIMIAPQVGKRILYTSV